LESPAVSNKKEQEFLRTIRKILSCPLPAYEAPSFEFRMDQSAAATNWKILQQHNGDLKQALAAQSRSQLGYGSEFRPTEILEPLFQSHCLWPNMKSILDDGAAFPLEPINEDLRKLDLTEALAMGNHKGATKEPQILENLMKEDVFRGYSLPIPLNKVVEIPGAIMAPQNVARQNTIDETGKIVGKDRLTHDQSWTYSSQAPSMNDRVREDELTPVQFGRTMIRVIHYIVNTRRRHPEAKMYMNKFDWKAAYRRAHVSSEMAVQTITQMISAPIAFIALRLTFGGRACPSRWCDLAEPTIDLANDLLACTSWDPNELHSPIQEKVPIPVSLPDTVPFESALEMIVDLPDETQGKADLYLDDGVTITADIGDNLHRAAAAIPLAMHIVGRPRSGNEPIPREELLALKKLAAEGGLAEIQIFLGWALNLRQLLVSLPISKFNAWSDVIEGIIACAVTCEHVMETLIGRLDHMCSVMPMARHFMNRLRFLKVRCHKKRETQVKEAELEDLKLMHIFLMHARDGVNMNLLTFRRPTIVLRLDASTSHGLGGYTADGRVWRWKLPTSWQGRFNINILEFMAIIIGVWIEVMEGRVPELSCLLAMSDNTSAAGWLRKSNFREEIDGTLESKADMKLKRILARHLATITLRGKFCLYSQWFPGCENDVADSCSRDFDIPDKDFLTHLRTKFPAQLPDDLVLKAVPPQIDSWLCHAVQRVLERTPSQGRPARASSEPGAAGSNSLTQSSSTTTTSSRISTGAPNKSSSEPLPKPCARPSIAQLLSRNWLQQQSKQPWTMWHRPLTTILRPTPDGTAQDRHHVFYQCNTVGTKTKIPLPCNRKRSHAHSSGKSGPTQAPSKTLRRAN
jgi:hypothetical protein